jgi:hypothetical protein
MQPASGGAVAKYVQEYRKGTLQLQTMENSVISSWMHVLWASDAVQPIADRLETHFAPGIEMAQRKKQRLNKRRGRKRRAKYSAHARHDRPD